MKEVVPLSSSIPYSWVALSRNKKYIENQSVYKVKKDDVVEDK